MSITRWFVGLACGSGGEGVDASLVETTGVGLNLNARHLLSLRRPFPPDSRELFAAPFPTGGTAAARHRMVAETAASATLQLCNQSRTDPNRVFAGGFLGSFQWHEPAGRAPSTHELGMTPLTADRTGLTLVSDFREQDVAAGGQGMPLSALADALVFRNPAEERLLIHLGAASSVVWLPAEGRVQNVMGFEAGPCNGLLDSAVRRGTGGRERFDAGGRHAVQGRCLDPLLDAWEAHPFFQQRPPRSLPRSAFGDDFVAEAVKLTAAHAGSLQDLLCSLSHFVVRSLVAACRRWLPPAASPRRTLLSGGGVRNGMLWRLLQQYAPDWQPSRLDEVGVPGSARNAVAAAVLAALSVDGVPASTPSATGAVGRLLGRFTPGSPGNWARCLRWMAEQSGDLTHPYRAA